MPRRIHGWFRLCVVAAVLSASWTIGCGAPPSEPAADSAKQPVSANAATASGPSDAAPQSIADKAPAGAATETWDVVYLQGERVGYIHSSYRKAEREGQPVLLIEADTRLALTRFGQGSDQQIRITSTETPAGGLIDFESTAHLGPAPMICRGKVAADRLLVETTTSGKTTKSELPWNAEIGGFSAMEQDLARRPMRPGEVRQQKLLMPLLSQVLVANVRLEARDYVQTALLTGEYELLEVDNLTELPGGLAMATTLWIDRQGEILKSRMEAFGQETYRTTREVALEQKPERPFDVGFDSVVRIAGPLDDPHAARKIRYRVELERGDPASVFASGGSQTTRLLDPHVIELTVERRRPEDLSGIEAEPKPVAADQEPNELIQSSDPKIVELAALAAGDEKDPWKAALALEKFVNKHIAKKSFSHAFATAAEVAAQPEGDCTEHAVLLAALARARGIPARVATGLVYMGTPPAFGFHMWDELYIGGHWIALDATLARGGIGAGHIKLAHSNLKDSTALGCFLPVAQVLGRLKIEVIDVQ